MTCVLFRVSVSFLRSPSSSPEQFSVHVAGTVLHPRSPNYFTGTIRPCSSDSSRSPVHLNRPPSSFSALFSVPVTGTILRLRSPSEPYRDAFAASDADVNKTGGVGRELIAVKIPCNAFCRHLQNHRAPSACRDSAIIVRTSRGQSVRRGRTLGHRT